ncbi:MAG: hypothetical protein ACOYN3_06305 [Acidimicrobiia bacterium]
MVISFHLVRVARHAIAGAALRSRSRRYRRVPGLRFLRTLGTGSGSSMTFGADLSRWATLAVWEDNHVYQQFLSSTLAPEQHPRVVEWWRAEFALVSAHGSWNRVNPFADCPEVDPGDGPVAVLTRATIPMRHWRAFRRAVPPVDADLHQHPGLLATVGIGERPVGLQATFSLWQNSAAVRAFAYEGPHAEVIRAEARHAWFAESCFARLAPMSSAGTWSGRDPLAATATPTGHNIPYGEPLVR